VRRGGAARRRSRGRPALPGNDLLCPIPQNRIRYSIAASLYYADGNKPHLDYARWMRGMLEKELRPYMKQANEKFKREYKGLEVRHKLDEDFDNGKLEREIAAVAPRADLIILDHLHYVDIKDDEHENRAYNKIISTLRHLANVHGTPILVVAHLRKAQLGKGQPIFPAIEDFHGTSELTKKCNTCILLGPAERGLDEPGHESPTLIRVAKCRADGALTKYVVRQTFDIRTISYKPTNAVGLLEKMDTMWAELKPDSPLYPHWAK
jgi:AAA domain